MSESPVTPEVPVIPILVKPKKRSSHGGGRPKGTTGPQKIGLSMDRRLKILSKIALDKNAKATDRINAVDLMTKILNDKAKETIDGTQETVLTFIDAKRPVEKAVEKPKDEQKQFKNNEGINVNTTTTTTILSDNLPEAPIQSVVQATVDTNNAVETFSFNVDTQNKINIGDILND